VDPELAAVIQKLLARDPAARYPSAADAAAALTPFASLSPHFPARLFQSKRPSTVHDEVKAQGPESPMPVTQRIVRPGPRPSEADDAQALSDALREGTPTSELRKAPTDLAMTPVPDGQLTRLPEAAPLQPPVPPGSRAWLWSLLAVLAALVALGIVLATK
jgi:hypothetical protein